MPTGVQSQVIAPGLTITNRRAVTTSDDADAQVNLGFEVTVNDGRIYKYLNVRDTLAIGQIVTVLNVDDADVDAAAADNTLTGTGDFTADEFSDGTADRREYYASINALTGAGQTRRIRSNTANVLTLDTAWTTALAADSDYVTFSPFHVSLTSGAGQRVFGVAIGVITDDGNGWIQVGGFCPQVRAAGDTDAVVLHEGLVSSAAAGIAKGLTAAGTTADEADKVFGSALMPSATADAAATGVPAMLHNVAH